MNDSQFRGDDYEFAVGAIHGIRSWGIDHLGRLHGVTCQVTWRPGENVAVCKAKREVECPEVAKAYERFKRERRRGGLGLGIYADPPRSCGQPGCYYGVHYEEKGGHHFDPDCQCGFWAYNEFDYEEHGGSVGVTGIIEGWGKTTIGTKGFRCEKAKVVALCRERDDGYLSLSTWLRLQQLYPAARFFDECDDMVTAFGGVLKTWEPVGDGFWDKPVKHGGGEPRSYAPGGFLASAISRHLTPPPLPPSFFGGLP